ncbi:hypothetical protein [Streptomyces sp. wa22]|uniref:hypothetical protein n=1 Tax=Streptomyces sp. wa22 TaxID=1828244 RepID=UPI0011C90A0D|nr:hypothetical protein [Streptomyces sp. wa22]TXS12840.1 hypothetical protein EAO68_22210 [Streptomyces sp. wa22]
MRANDFFRTVSTGTGGWGEPLTASMFEVELVERLREGPLEGTLDRAAAEGLSTLVHTELEHCGTDSAQRLDDEEIAAAVRSLKTILRRLGIPFNPPFRDFRGFHGYWSAQGMGGGGGWAARRGYLNKLFSPVWLALDELEASEDEGVGFRGVDGAPKNIIFASTGFKPEIVMSQVIDGAIEIVEQEDSCLVYNRSLTEAGLTWGQLVDWWRERNGMGEADDRTAAISLYERLKASLASDAERYVFHAFSSRYAGSNAMQEPALLPQVYLHFDPLTERQRRTLNKPRRLARERMDFLLLLPGGVRIVIEVDGKHHYARETSPGSGQWEVAADLYSEMVAEDRALRLKGYEVFRFGGREILESREDLSSIRRFFGDLEARYWPVPRS